MTRWTINRALNHIEMMDEAEFDPYRKYLVIPCKLRYPPTGPDSS